MLKTIPPTYSAPILDDRLGQMRLKANWYQDLVVVIMYAKLQPFYAARSRPEGCINIRTQRA